MFILILRIMLSKKGLLVKTNSRGLSDILRSAIDEYWERFEKKGRVKA